MEIYSEVTIPGRAVPSGFNAQRYLMKQLQPERFQTRIHRTAARRGACGPCTAQGSSSTGAAGAPGARTARPWGPSGRRSTRF